MKYTLPELPYKYDALEPYIDAATMEIHHTKHHQAYIDKLNLVLEKYPQFAERKLEDLMRSLASLDMDEKDRTMLKNHGGGHLNHSFFWTIMGPSKKNDEELSDRIRSEFGSMEKFTDTFSAAAVNHFGSGWAWLVNNEQSQLEIYSTSNQDSPLVKGHTPLIGLDIWEHAYYLKYQNRRSDYVKNWWNVLTLL